MFSLYSQYMTLFPPSRSIHHLSDASMEGFKNKIRWLIRDAYGFRDPEYFKLNIFQPREVSCVRDV